MKAPSVKPVRCVIYTRVSTDQGLDQEFNSLDAQYEAAAAYIKSQAHAGCIAKDKKSQVPIAGRAGFFKSLSASRNQARPHHRDAAVIRWRDDRINDDRHELAAAFGARFSRWSGPQEARPQFDFRAER